MKMAAKKLFSVVLSVLVLAAGFGTMLSEFITAEPEWTYNYDELVTQVDSVNEKALAPLRVAMGEYVEAPDYFGFYDYFGIATNLDATGVFAGLRVEDTFFSEVSDTLLYGGMEINDAHPFVIYEVESGTEFRIQYYTYTKEHWADIGLGSYANDLYFASIFASSDGVNWVPANFENDIASMPTEVPYDLVIATVANVGANTRFVKFEFPVDPSLVSDLLVDIEGSGGVPQDALLIQKVKLTAPTAAVAEKLVSFQNSKVTANGEKISLDEVFVNYPATATVDDNGFGLVTYTNSQLGGGTTDMYPWGTFYETDRDYYLRVQPGTRFSLSFNDQTIHNDLADALVFTGKIENTEQFAVRVFSSANLKNGWVEHKLAPSAANVSHGIKFSYNFIIPENHTYVKFVTPISGSVGSIKDAQGNTVTAQAGNTFCITDHIIYTPYDESGVFFDIDEDYASIKASAATIYLNHNFSTTSPDTGFHSANLDTTYKLGSVQTERTDDELAFLLYKVKGGTHFKAKLMIGWSGNWRKEGYDNNKSADAEEMHFAILTSPDAAEWTLQYTLGLTDDFYVRSSTASNNVYYNADVFVPEEHSYVKIISYCRGYYKYSGGSVYFNNQFMVGGASYVSADYNDDITSNITVNDYIAKSETILNNETKCEFAIYNYFDVETSANGIAANLDAENAFVEYKVNNNSALVIKSDNELKMEVSYDGKKFVKAQIYPCGDTYTVNTLDGKQYIRVYLDTNESIKAVFADALAPTATFINAAGNKEVIELDFFGETPVPSINTSRVGYIFSGWDNTVKGLYLDATFTAQYIKSDKTYNIATQNGGVVLCVGMDYCEANTTTVAARFDDMVTLEAPATCDGLVFDKWMVFENGEPTEIVFSHSNKLSFLVNEDICLYAKYAEEKSEVVPFIYTSKKAQITKNENSGLWNMSVIWQVNVPDNVEVCETGILVSTYNFDDDAMCDGVISNGETDIIKKRSHKNGAAGKTLMYTITDIEAENSTTRFARPYAKITANGVAEIIYGDTLSHTYTVSE